MSCFSTSSKASLIDMICSIFTPLPVRWSVSVMHFGISTGVIHLSLDVTTSLHHVFQLAHIARPVVFLQKQRPAVGFFDQSLRWFPPEKYRRINLGQFFGHFDDLLHAWTPVHKRGSPFVLAGEPGVSSKYKFPRCLTSSSFCCSFFMSGQLTLPRFSSSIGINRKNTASITRG